MRAFNILILLVLLMGLTSCDETTKVNPDAFTLNGRVTFADSSFKLNGSTGTDAYYVFAWKRANWPLVTAANYSQKIDIVKQNNKYVLSYDYRLEATTGMWVVGVYYKNDLLPQGRILGLYGCNLSDTACFQSPYQIAHITTTEGLLNIDVDTWADTSKAYNTGFPSP